MNVGRFFGRLAATGLAAGYVGLAVAADTPGVVAPAAPAAIGEVCPTCTAGVAGAPCGKAGCRTCGGHGRPGCSPKRPVVGELRPGACFGYFQTQWHRWEDVCPIPYQGTGLNDAPQRLPTVGGGIAPAPAAGPQPKSSTPLPPPTSDTPGAPAPKSDTGLPKTNPAPAPGVPAIPSPPNKFGN